MPQPTFTTRLAPSPTGALHLGNARTFALTWWWARAAGARVLLRIEDLDSPRKKPGAVEDLRVDLAWLGLDWDAETPIQTSREERHVAVLRELVAAGRAYACTCSRRDVEEAQSAPHDAPGELSYPGRCRGSGLLPAEAATRAGRPAALRFLVPPGGVVVNDLVAGTRTIDLLAASGDFVIGRATAAGDIAPGYQLAVVLDDADDGVTRVIRGADLLLSAARQILLQQAIGLAAVEYAHLPLVVGNDGRRLAKRHGDTRIASLRAAGVDVRDIWAWIAATVGRPFQSVPALVLSGFDPAWVPPDPVVAPSSMSVV